MKSSFMGVISGTVTRPKKTGFYEWSLSGPAGTEEQPCPFCNCPHGSDAFVLEGNKTLILAQIKCNSKFDVFLMWSWILEKKKHKSFWIRFKRFFADKTRNVNHTKVEELGFALIRSCIECMWTGWSALLHERAKQIPTSDNSWQSCRRVKTWLLSPHCQSA